MPRGHPLLLLVMLACGVAPGPASAASGTLTVRAEPAFSSAIYPDPDPAVHPKDFAFVCNTVGDPPYALFHLFYIRHNTTLAGDYTERAFGHAWSRDLTTWRVDTAAFSVRATWDAGHVWAPSIVPYDGRSYMFYTGVGAHGNQRIGYASTGQLDTTDTVWARESTWVFSADSTAWADRVGHLAPGAQQFRDPFVFPDPDSSGRFLMLYAAENKYEIPSGYNAVGLARSLPGTLSRWRDLGYYRRTDYAHAYVTDVESPHVFRSRADPSRWQLMFTSGFGAPIQSVVFEQGDPGMAVSDTTVSGWSFRTPLYGYLGNDSTVYDWRATEHLTVGVEEFLAGYNERGIAIAKLEWVGTSFVLKPPAVTAVRGEDEGGSGPGLVVADLRPGAPRIVLRVELPVATSCSLVVYDVLGRRTRTLLEGGMTQGSTSVTWDCRDESGTRVPSGAYVARLSCRAGTRVVRLVVLR